MYSKKREIDYLLIALIESTYECGNCKHDYDGYADDYCTYCHCDYGYPTKYRPAKNTIQEKVYYERYDSITEKEYREFLST